MDIQIQSTPPKRNRNYEDFSTPPKKCLNFDQYVTPQKKTPPRNLATPIKMSATPIKGQNPESKKFKSKGTNLKTPSSNRKVQQFQISRLQMDYIFEKTLGQGNFSQVGLYRSRMSGDLFAIKQTKSSSMSVNEAQALGTLSIFNQKTKNIVRYYHSWVENSSLYLVMEYCTHNLALVYKRHRVNRKRLEQSEIKDYLKQGLQGLKSMHENKMVHLDIKPDNLLFKDGVMKISDLGLTRVAKLKSDGDLEQGDSRYLARELLNYYPQLDITKSDIFSLGMTIYEGLSLEELPNNGEEWQNYRQYGLFLKDRMDLQDYTQDLLEIVQAMTHPDWNQRPTAAQILQSKYFGDSLKKRNHFIMNHGHKHERNSERKKENSL